MSFQSGLSGLNASTKHIDIIGNNIANANTAGFKGSRAIFGDVYASSLAGAGANNVGIGTKISEVQQEFTQGNITVTNNPLDIAINGRGFFRFENGSVTTYSRNGQLHVDQLGYIVNSDNLRLTGYPVDATNSIIASSPTALRLTTSDLQPRPTSIVQTTLNLDSRSDPIAAAFSPTNAATYTSTTSTGVYDSLGNSHAVTMYFSKTANPGEWDLYATVDGGGVADVDFGAGAGLPMTLTFDNTGLLTTPMPMNNVALTLTNGAVTPLVTNFDFTGTTQFGSDFGVTTLSQDGYTSGRLTGFDISPDGMVLGRYSNGQANTLGQVVLANFANPQGLRSVGGNQWEETAASGQAVIGSPLSGSMGALQSAAIEDSNVDLTEELVNMITAQRAYQANAQAIKTQDQTLQTIVNLR